MITTNVTERPILFSTDMVKAILSGRKTQTRRTKGLEAINNSSEQLGDDIVQIMVSGYHVKYRSVKCPYGKIGDILWVRETWCEWYNKSGHFYKADELYPGYNGGKVGRPTDYDQRGEKWRPSIHMPKKASRIWLQITNIRVERMQDITEEDAIAEGIKYRWGGYINYLNPEKTLSPDKLYDGKCGAIISFFSLWQSINGGESLDANPWVWVIEFKVLSTTGKPSKF